MLAAAGGADEFEGLPQVPEADRHGDAPGMVRRFNAGITGHVSAGGEIAVSSGASGCFVGVG